MLDRVKKMLKNGQFRCIDDCNITFEEMQSKIEAKAILIDVRSRQEYNEGHLHNAIQLADYEIKKKYKTVLPDKQIEIILYCQNGERSKKALKLLKKLGYVNVYNLCGGLENIN